MAETSKELKDQLGTRKEGSDYTSAQQKSDQAEGERPSGDRGREKQSPRKDNS